MKIFFLITGLVYIFSAPLPLSGKKGIHKVSFIVKDDSTKITLTSGVLFSYNKNVVEVLNADNTFMFKEGNYNLNFRAIGYVEKNMKMKIDRDTTYSITLKQEKGWME